MESVNISFERVEQNDTLNAYSIRSNTLKDSLSDDIERSPN